MADQYDAPPVSADDIEFEDLPAWPKVIGIISIIWGVIGLICGGIGIGWMFMQPSVMGNVPGGVPPVMLTVDPIQVGVMGLSIVWTIFLIVAGALTLARKPAGRPAHLVYAIGAVFIAMIGLYFQYKMQNEIAQWIRDNPDAEFSKNSSTAANVIGMVVGMAIAFAYPLFTLLWFGLVKRNNADLAKGVVEAAA